MVQIIQSGPTQATLRQQALDEATRGIIGGIQGLQQQRETERQRALKALDATMDLRGKGYDVNVDQVAQVYNEPQKGFGDIFSKRTSEYTDKLQREAEKASRELESQNADIAYKKAQTEDLAAQSPFKAQEKQLQLQKLQSDIALSPIARRKAEAEIKKIEADAMKARSEGMAPDPKARLAKMDSTSKDKVGNIAAVVKGLSNVRTALDKGFVPATLFDANTPLVGRFISDNDLTNAQGLVNEAFGRLQSGGAIGNEETVRFNAMGPRGGDTKEQRIKKIEAQKQFILNKANAFGFSEKDLIDAGFDIGQGSVRDNAGAITRQALGALHPEEQADYLALKQKQQQMAGR